MRAYTLPGPRRNRIHSICHITLKKDGVQLGFIRGHLLNHPGLRSDGNTYKRSLLLTSLSEFDTDASRLVRDAEALASKSMDEFRVPAGGKAPSLKPV